MPYVIVFGCGMTGRHLVPLLRRRGLEVVVTRRRVQERMLEDGVRLLPFDEETPLPQEVVLGASAAVVSIAPQGQDGADIVLNRHGADLRKAAQLGWVGYLSSGSVYGDHGGAWIDETAPLLATHAVGMRRIKAEEAWEAWHKKSGEKIGLSIFRLAGIYGAGRSVLHAVLEGRARRIIKAGQFFGRIHVEDAARVIDAALAMHQGRNARHIYNVCDDVPVPPQDVITHAARLLKMPPPPEEPYETAELSPMARGFYAGSKRMRNDKIKKALGIALRYPDYRAGLAALMSDLRPSTM